MSVHELSTRLKALSESTRSVNGRISVLAKLSAPASSEATPNASNSNNNTDTANSPALTPSDNDRLALSAEIHADLADLDEDLSLLAQEAEDVTRTVGRWSSGAQRTHEERDRERIAIAGQVERAGEDLKLARAQFRRAQLQAKRNAESAERRHRETLFRGVQEGGETGQRRSGSKRGTQGKATEDSILLGAAHDVTTALRRTQQLMSSELARSQFAHETLQRSTAALNALNESYSGLDTLLASSKSLVASLLRSSKSDTWYLETALWILLATLGWLVFRRILYGPIRYLAYLPTKWILRIFLSVLQIFSSAVFAAGSGSAGRGAAVENVAGVGESVIAAATAAAAGSSGIPGEIPLGKRSGRLNPALPRMHVPSGMGGKGAKSGPQGAGAGVEQVGEQRREQGEHETTSENADPGVEAIGEEDDEEDEEGDREGHEHERGDENENEAEPDAEAEGGNGETVLREPDADETPNPKKRMWEEPETDNDDGNGVGGAQVVGKQDGGHDEL